MNTNKKMLTVKNVIGGIVTGVALMYLFGLKSPIFNLYLGMLITSMLFGLFFDCAKGLLLKHLSGIVNEETAKKITDGTFGLKSKLED